MSDSGDLVRIEGVRGSNPLSSTEFLQVRWPVRVPGSRLGSPGVGAKPHNSGMAGAARRGYGEDGIYFDHRATAGTAPFIRPAPGAGAG
jgi:hypothetical protein